MKKALQESEYALRPALPMLLFAILAMWIGLYFAELCIWEDRLKILVAATIALVIIAVVLVLISKRSRLEQRFPDVTRNCFVAIIALVVSLVLGTVYWLDLQNMSERFETLIDASDDQRVILRIADDPKQGAISFASTANIQLERDAIVSVRVYWQNDQRPQPMGTTISAGVDFKPLTKTQRSLHQRGLIGSVSLKDIEVCTDKGNILDPIYKFRKHNVAQLSQIEGEGSALLKGVLLGETSVLDVSEAGLAYRATGLSHLVAVSGSHLVVIAALLAWVLERLHLPRWAKITVISLFLAAFVILTGLQPSAIRATVMTTIASIGPLIGRRAHIPSALSLAAICMLGLHPPTAFSVGFWLSVFAVFGLTIFHPLLSDHIVAALPNAVKKKNLVMKFIGKPTLEILTMTVTAQLATVAITAPIFSTLSLVSPLANLLVTPFVTLLVAVGVILLCLLPLLGQIGTWLIFALSKIADLSIVLAKFCAKLPFACIPTSLDLAICVVLALMIATFIYIKWPRPSWRLNVGLFAVCTLVTCMFALSMLFPQKAQVVMLDVGQGDAILVREGNSNVLVDTGNNNGALLKALARQHVFRLDAVIITHLDDDHCGSLEALVGVIEVKNVFFADGLLEAKSDEKVFRVAEQLSGRAQVRPLAYKDLISLGEKTTLRVLWPKAKVFEGGNDESICLALEYDDNRDGLIESKALLTGDLEKEQLKVLLREIPDPGFDVLKVGHHGSKVALTSSIVEQLDCEIALIGVGKDNRYGHPTEETLQLLMQADVAIFRTDLNGNIKLEFEGTELILYCDNMKMDDL